MSAIIRVTDSVGRFCLKEYFGVACGNDITDWYNNPDPCRLRIAGYTDGLFAPCSDCNAGVGNAWDGTFTLFVGTGAYFADLAFNTVGGFVMPAGQTKLTYSGGTGWTINVYCSGPGLKQLYQANLAVFDPGKPCGVYTKTDPAPWCGGLPPGPATVTIEAFVP